MNYLKTGFLTVMFAVITLVGNGSSIGDGIESQISGKKTEISGTSRNKTTTTKTSTTKTTTTTSTHPL
jgi:hypothetical protein